MTTLAWILVAASSLGEAHFSDAQLAGLGANGRACSTCHVPEDAFQQWFERELTGEVGRECGERLESRGVAVGRRIGKFRVGHCDDLHRWSAWVVRPRHIMRPPGPGAPPASRSGAGEYR